MERLELILNSLKEMDNLQKDFSDSLFKSSLPIKEIEDYFSEWLRNDEEFIITLGNMVLNRVEKMKCDIQEIKLRIDESTESPN